MNILKLGIMALAASLAHADTITTLDSRTWNGAVTRIQNGVVTLNATFANSSKTLSLGAGYIRAIEFNTTRYNAGAVVSVPGSKNSSLAGTIYLKQNTESKVKGPLHCDDISSASGSGQVSCRPTGGGNPQSVYTKDVVRILVSH